MSFQNSAQACRCLQCLSENGDYSSGRLFILYLKQILLITSHMCSSDAGTADGAGLFVTAEGAAEVVYSGVDGICPNTAVHTVCTPTQQRTI